MSSKIIIIDENGAVLQELDGSSHYIRSKVQDEAYRKYKQEQDLSRDGRKFVFSNNQNVEEVTKRMTLVEAGAMFSIMVHLDFNSDGIIVKNGKPITMTDLQDILKIGKRRVIDIVNKLESLSLLFRVKQGRKTIIQVNDSFHFIGKNLDKKSYLTKVYTTKAKELLDSLSLQELGLLYKIIPHFHYEKMVLCKNANEKNPSKLELLTATELADLIGVDRRTLSRLLPALRKKGILMSVRTGSKAVSYVINPDLFYRMDRIPEDIDTLKMIFDMLTD